MCVCVVCDDNYSEITSSQNSSCSRGCVKVLVAMAIRVAGSPSDVSLKHDMATESRVCTRAFPRLASGCEGVCVCGGRVYQDLPKTG